MEFIYEKNRIYSKDDDGELLTEVTFPKNNKEVVKINHVYVNKKLRGQGIASEIMLKAYNYIKDNNKKIIASCPYAISWFKKHPSYQDIVINVKTKE